MKWVVSRKVLTDHDCAIDNNTFIHEVGHMMGGNHVENTNQLPQTWIDDIINNTIYADAFAQSQSSFDTVMSTLNSRRKYFSNPNVALNGLPTGVTGTKNNARIIDELSPVMAAYRTRPDLIFINGFE
ncbi:MAG: hypothetical protein L3J83_11735 [Proteobacteria bacterium]|nr:hypothetical protein [Pseudomonadota bacterium]